jgi:hypothetical protein
MPEELEEEELRTTSFAARGPTSWPGLRALGVKTLARPR